MGCYYIAFALAGRHCAGTSKGHNLPQTYPNSPPSRVSGDNISFKNRQAFPAPMYVALTGTPGTGKTSAATILSKRGFAVSTVEELAAQHGALETAEGGKEVDTDKLSKSMPESPQTLIIVGHLAHHLPNDFCIILRCHPEEIRKRLSARNYSREKLMENLEAEAIDVVLTEAIEACETVFEIDTSNVKPEQVANAIENIINGDADEYSPGKIDWSGAVMDWY